MVTAGLDFRYKQNAKFFYEGPRSKKQFYVRECGREEWKKFRRYHYLNSEISSASICFGLYDDDNIIGFIGVLHQPHSVNKKIKRVTRLVILPDYQGIGLGTKFLNIIADRYKKQGYDFTIVTSAKNLIHALMKSEKWFMTRYSATKSSSSENAIDFKRSTLRGDCKTASFKYI